MPGNPPATVLFDWDGTLFDSGAASLRAFRKSMADFGLTFTDEHYRAIYTPRWYHMYEALGLPGELWKPADQRWLHHYGSEAPGLIEGAAEVLAELARRGTRLGIVTNATRHRIDKELAGLGMDSLFCSVVCHEDVTHSKPHPEGVVKALAAAGCEPGSCWYVGDTPADVEQGRSAGVFTVGVLSDYVDRERMHQSRPGLMLRNLGELPAAVYRLTSTDSSNNAGGS